MTTHNPTLPEYRAQHLRDRLAHEDIAERGVCVELGGNAVVVWGPVSRPGCRGTVLRMAAEALHPLAWCHDLTVVSARLPDREEELP